jgi:hypothetical protein
MALWRLLGKVRQAKNREELEAQSFEGWNPWRDGMFQLREPDIVVPDPRDPTKRCHAHIYEVSRASWVTKFASLFLPDASNDSANGFWYFYVPATVSTDDSFEADAPKVEGYWRRTPDEDSELPWPAPVNEWADREMFLASLDRAEAESVKSAFRGYSFCRLCKCQNGHEEYQILEWKWPAGFRHYVAEHRVRPSLAFENFIRNRN